MKMHFLVLRLALALALALPLLGLPLSRAQAFEIVGGDSVTVAVNEVIDDDAFIVGETITVDGTINGDLFATGSVITVNGTVNGSLFVAGQTIVINGPISGSLYGGGMTVTLTSQARVERNVAVGLFGFVAEAGSAIGRDLVIGGYQAQLRGEVERDVAFGGGALEVDGVIGGDLRAEVEAPGSAPQAPPFAYAPGMPAMLPPGLRLSPQAEIGGQIDYTSPADQSDAIQAQPEGGVVYSTPAPGEGVEVRPQPGFRFNLLGWFVDRLREFVTLLLLGAAAALFVPHILNAAAEQARTQPLPSAGWGLVVVILGYAGAVLAGIGLFLIGLLFGIITLGGLSDTVFTVGFSSLAVALAVFTLLVSYGSKVVVAYLIGRLSLQVVSPANAQTKWLPLLAGVAIYVLLRAVPFVGWVVGLLATIVGLGAMWLLIRQRRAAAAPPAPAATAP